MLAELFPANATFKTLESSVGEGCTTAKDLMGCMSAKELMGCITAEDLMGCTVAEDLIGCTAAEDSTEDSSEVVPFEIPS
jgi:hypothetical protein